MSVLDSTGFNSPQGFLTQDFNISPFNYSAEECYGQAIALQTDGKIIMTGKVKNNFNLFEIGLARYLTNGNLDTTFGFNGLTSSLLQDNLSVNCNVDVNAITLQNDGKIIVCGNLFNSLNFYDIFVARYLPNGLLDLSFGSIGYILITPSNFSTEFAPVNFDNCYGLSVQIDTSTIANKIVVCGYVRVSTTTKYRICLARISSINGNLDISFGTNGLVQQNFGTPFIDKFGWSLAISSIGEYFISGFQQTNPSPPDNKFIIAKFNTLGVPDVLFGTNGLVVIPNFFLNSSDGSTSIIIQQDNKIVAAGTSIQQPIGEEVFAICRLDPITGLLDNTFGINGQVVTDLSSQIPSIYLNGFSIQQQTDGKLVLGGYWSSPTSFNQEISFALARYHIDGSLDLSFGINGTGLILEDLTPGTMKEKGFSLIIQPNGQILLGGIMGEMSDISDKMFFIIARYIFTPVPPIPPVPNSNTVPIVPICFPAGTPVLTDQGYIAIENINPLVNTIRNKSIVAITKTISNHDKVVCFEKHSLGINLPNKQTIVSLNHGIIYNRKLIPARRFVGSKRGIYFKNYNGELLYNVLLEKYTYMIVNGLKVETLNPKNLVAKLYTNEFSPEQKLKIILKINNEHYKYKNFNNIKNNITRRNYEVHRYNPIIGKIHLKTQKNYSFLNNIQLKNNNNFNPQIQNHTIKQKYSLIKNYNKKFNPILIHKYTRIGRRRR